MISSLQANQKLMKLDIKTRLLLPQIMPPKGDYVTLTIKKDLLEKIAITQQEIKDVEISTEYINGEASTKWNKEKDPMQEIEFTELETDLIRKQLKDLDEKKELTDDLMSMYKMFN